MTPGNGEARMIRVWKFADAPAEFKALSPHGGDEDYIAWVPLLLRDDYLPFLEEGRFANDVARIEWIDGSIILIGAHS